MASKAMHCCMSRTAQQQQAWGPGAHSLILPRKGWTCRGRVGGRPCWKPRGSAGNRAEQNSCRCACFRSCGQELTWPAVHTMDAWPHDQSSQGHCSLLICGRRHWSGSRGTSTVTRHAISGSLLCSHELRLGQFSGIYLWMTASAAQALACKRHAILEPPLTSSCRPSDLLQLLLLINHCSTSTLKVSGAAACTTQTRRAIMPWYQGAALHMCLQCTQTTPWGSSAGTDHKGGSQLDQGLSGSPKDWTVLTPPGWADCPWPSVSA